MLVVGLCHGALAAAVADDAGGARYPLIAGVVLVTAASWVQLFRHLRHGETARTEAAGDRWFSRRRLKPYPTSIEAETAVLFLAPLLLPERWIVAVMLAAYAFYALSIADNSRRIFHAAATGP